MRSNSRPVTTANGKASSGRLTVRGLSPLKGETRSSVLNRLRSQQVVVNVTDLQLSVSQIPHLPTEPAMTSDASTQTECVTCPSCQFAFTLENVAVNGRTEQDSTTFVQPRRGRLSAKKLTRVSSSAAQRLEPSEAPLDRVAPTAVDGTSSSAATSTHGDPIAETIDLVVSGFSCNTRFAKVSDISQIECSRLQLTNGEGPAPIEHLSTAAPTSTTSLRKKPGTRPRKRVRQSATPALEAHHSVQRADTEALEDESSLRSQEKTDRTSKTVNAVTPKVSPVGPTTPEAVEVPAPERPLADHCSMKSSPLSSSQASEDVIVATKHTSVALRKTARGRVKVQVSETDVSTSEVVQETTPTSMTRRASRQSPGTRKVRAATTGFASSRKSAKTAKPAKSTTSAAEDTGIEESACGIEQVATQSDSLSVGAMKSRGQSTLTSPIVPQAALVRNDTPTVTSLSSVPAASETTTATLNAKRKSKNSKLKKSALDSTSESAQATRRFTRQEEARMIEECKRRIWQVRLERLSEKRLQTSVTLETLPNSVIKQGTPPATVSLEPLLLAENEAVASTEITTIPPTVIEEQQTDSTTGTEITQNDPTTRPAEQSDPSEWEPVRFPERNDEETVVTLPNRGNETIEPSQERKKKKKKESDERRKKEKHGRMEKKKKKSSKEKKKREKDREQRRSSKKSQINILVPSDGGKDKNLSTALDSTELEIPQSMFREGSSDLLKDQDPSAQSTSAIKKDLELPALVSEDIFDLENHSALTSVVLTTDPAHERTTAFTYDAEKDRQQTSATLGRIEDSFELSFELSDDELFPSLAILTGSFEAPQDLQESAEANPASDSEGSSGSRATSLFAKKGEAETNKITVIAEDVESPDRGRAATLAAESSGTVPEEGSIPNSPRNSQQGIQDPMLKPRNDCGSHASGKSAPVIRRKSALGKKLKSSSALEKLRQKLKSKPGKVKKPLETSISPLEKTGIPASKEDPPPESAPRVEKDSSQGSTEAKKPYKIPKLKAGQSKPHPQNPAPVVIEETDLPLSASSVGLPAFLLESPPLETIAAAIDSLPIKPALTMFVGDRKRKSLCFAESNTVVEFSTDSPLAKRPRPEERNRRTLKPARSPIDGRLIPQGCASPRPRPPPEEIAEDDDELTIDLDESEYVSDVEHNPVDDAGESPGDQSPASADGAVSELLESLNEDYELDNVDDENGVDAECPGLPEREEPGGTGATSTVAEREAEACGEVLLCGVCSARHCLKKHTFELRDVVDFFRKSKDVDIQRRVLALVDTWKKHLGQPATSKKLGPLLEDLYLGLLTTDEGNGPSATTVELLLKAMLKQEPPCSAKVVAKVLERMTFQHFPQLMYQLYRRLVSEQMHLEKISWSRLLRCFIDANMCEASSHALHTAMTHCTTPFEPSDVEVNRIMELYIREIQKSGPTSTGKVISKTRVASEALKLLCRFDVNVVSKLKHDLRRDLIITIGPHLNEEGKLVLQERFRLAPPPGGPPLAIPPNFAVRPIHPPPFRPEIPPPVLFHRPPPPRMPGLLPIRLMPMRPPGPGLGPMGLGPGGPRPSPRAMGPRPGAPSPFFGRCPRPMDEGSRPMGPGRGRLRQQVNDLDLLFERFQQADVPETTQITDFLAHETFRTKGKMAIQFLMKVAESFPARPEQEGQPLGPHRQAAIDLFVRVMLHYVECNDLRSVYECNLLALTYDLPDWNESQHFEPRLYVYSALSLVNPLVDVKPESSDVAQALQLLVRFREENPSEAQTPELKQLEQRILSLCRNVEPNLEDLREFGFYMNTQQNDEADQDK